MKRTKHIVAIVALLCASGVAAQNAKLDNADNREVLRMGLYPPDIIMRMQQQLGITTEQRKKIAGLVRDFQGEVTELQWAMPNEQQKLRALLMQRDIDPEPALAQAEQVLGMESEFKLAHFRLLIAIKNTLTDPQIEQINTAIRRRMQHTDRIGG